MWLASYLLRLSSLASKNICDGTTLKEPESVTPDAQIVRRRASARQLRKLNFGGGVLTGPRLRQRFFDMNLTLWLDTRGASRVLEQCVKPRTNKGATNQEVECAPSIASRPWWPFGNCSRR